MSDNERDPIQDPIEDEEEVAYGVSVACNLGYFDANPYDLLPVGLQQLEKEEEVKEEGRI
jgi:hypothetical protein